MQGASQALFTHFQGLVYANKPHFFYCVDRSSLNPGVSCSFNLFVISHHRCPTCYIVRSIQREMTPLKSNHSAPAWALLPLRLFLGITFIYAGVQKLDNPQYFNASAPGYIGKQIAGFAAASPLHNFLLHVAAPHALFFGLLVACGEIAIGVGVLAGLLLRPAAFFGLLLNTILFLSASWRVYPYFYGADIVFIFCWLTLLLNGPAHTGLPTLDETIARSLIRHAAPERRSALALWLRIIPGIDTMPAEQPGQPHSDQYRSIPLKQRKNVSRAREARRNFLLGLITGSAGIASLAGILYLRDIARHE